MRLLCFVLFDEMFCSRDKQRKQSRESKNCTLTTNFTFQLFSNEGDEQKHFQQNKQNLNTADL